MSRLILDRRCGTTDPLTRLATLATLSPKGARDCNSYAGQDTSQERDFDSGVVIGMKTFGAAAPLQELQRKFGFEPDRVVAAAREQLGRR